MYTNTKGCFLSRISKTTPVPILRCPFLRWLLSLVFLMKVVTSSVFPGLFDSQKVHLVLKDDILSKGLLNELVMVYCRLLLATGLTCTTSGQCPWFFTISQISSCMKKITVWSTLVWKRTNKEPGRTARKIRTHPFFARNQDMFVEKPPGILITHQR